MRPLLVATMAVASISVSSTAIAQAPDLMSHQGVLTNNVGVVVADGNYNIVFALYDTLSGGSPVWSETHNGANAVATTDGIFNVVLGSLVTLSNVVFDKPMYLGLSVNGDPEIVPRVSLTAVPYARALPGFYTFPASDADEDSYNVVGGAANNVVGAGVIGATLSGGGGISYSTPYPNAVNANFGTIGGGFGNTSTGFAAVIGGGNLNNAGGEGATVGGGRNNTANGIYSTAGGGDGHILAGLWATVAGGGANKTTANYGTVGGGGLNEAGEGATVSGGQQNKASGKLSMVPGGVQNEAKGFTSFAAGWFAKANHNGAFVWQDSTGLWNDALSSTGSNQFLARASGGFFFYTAPATNLTAGISLPAGSGTWTALSSKTSKTNFGEIDTRSYLDRVASLDLKEWSYKTEAGVSHVGPMAEDFYAAFGLGPTDKGISGVDGYGVALAAIQGLYELVQTQQAEIDRMRAAMALAGIEPQ